MYPCYVLQQMSNNDMGISHLRFQNIKNTLRDRAYWTALPNLYKSLLRWNNCKKVAYSRWCQWGYDSWIHQGRAVKTALECILDVNYFPMALTLSSSVEIRELIFFVKGDKADPFIPKVKSKIKKPVIRADFSLSHFLIILG